MWKGIREVDQKVILGDGWNARTLEGHRGAGRPCGELTQRARERLTERGGHRAHGKCRN